MAKSKVKATASLRLEVDDLIRKGVETLDVETEVTAAGLTVRKKIVKKRKPKPPPIGNDSKVLVSKE